MLWNSQGKINCDVTSGFSTEMCTIKWPEEEVWWMKREIMASSGLQGVRTTGLGWLAVTSAFIPQTSAGEGTRWKAMHLVCNLYCHNIPPWPHYSAPGSSHVLLFAQKHFQMAEVGTLLTVKEGLAAFWSNVSEGLDFCCRCCLTLLACLFQNTISDF